MLDISQLPNKFYGYFATPLECVISWFADLLGAFVHWIIFIWCCQHCTIQKYHSC